MNSDSNNTPYVPLETSEAPESLESFTSLVAGGINRRGFHIANDESLGVLWGGRGISPIEKLQRVHSFASEHGWEVAAKDQVRVVLFQVAGRRSILPCTWRLSATN